MLVYKNQVLIKTENVFTYSVNYCFKQYNFVTEVAIMKVSLDIERGIKILQNYYLIVKIGQFIAKLQSFFRKRF